MIFKTQNAIASRYNIETSHKLKILDKTINFDTVFKSQAEMIFKTQNIIESSSH